MKMKQFVVIGLGNFGYYLSTELFSRGHDVLAIDMDEKIIQEIKDKVSRAVVADATDKDTLESLGVKTADTVIVCIGTPMESSVLTTLNLKDIGVAHVSVKAISEVHSRLLYKVGANDVFFPEKDQALELAQRLHSPNILEYLPFLENYGIIELSPPKEFIGKQLKELNLINTYGIQAIAIQELIPERLVMVPKGDFIIKGSDIMILLGPTAGLTRLQNI
ncbi:MAG: TrkA family potassium uptake protein [Pseudomonadota bacterium]